MKKKREKQNKKQILIDWLRYRIGSLGAQQQNFVRNPVFMHNVKMANIGLIQNDIEALKKLLSKIDKDLI